MERHIRIKSLIQLMDSTFNNSKIDLDIMRDMRTIGKIHNIEMLPVSKPEIKKTYISI